MSRFRLVRGGMRVADATMLLARTMLCTEPTRQRSAMSCVTQPCSVSMRHWAMHQSMIPGRCQCQWAPRHSRPLQLEVTKA